MDHFLEHIKRPKVITLTVFALLSFTTLTAYVWWFSFVWEFVFGVTHYIMGLLVLLTVCLLVSIAVDKKLNSNFKRYLVIAILELLAIWSIAKPVRTWQINNSFERAKAIIEPLEKFKNQFGSYPTNLADLESKLEIDVPFWSCVGTAYYYQKNGSEKYWLSFQSYYGYTAHYNKDKDEWIVVD